LGTHTVIVYCKSLMTTSSQQQWSRRPSKLCSPVESPKSVFAHEHVTVCPRWWVRYTGHVAGGASPGARYARHAGEVSWDPKPHTPKRDPSGRTAAMCYPSRPDRSRASLSSKQRSLSTTKNEKQ
jgi:hypothetical protein